MSSHWPPSIDDYCGKREHAFTYENQMLYRMCALAPLHNDPYTTAGKIIAIGRIYAASPQRGAGKPQIAGSNFFHVLADHFIESGIDDILGNISPIAQLPNENTYASILYAHDALLQAISDGIIRWSGKPKSKGWPLQHISFASKYLHFHRPNAFPIFDSIVRRGLKSEGFKGTYKDYADFCDTFCAYTASLKQPWTPRCVDMTLLELGAED